MTLRLKRFQDSLERWRAMTDEAKTIANYEARIREARLDLVINELTMNMEGVINDVVIERLVRLMESRSPYKMTLPF